MKSALLILGLAVLPFVAGPAATPMAPAPRLEGSSWNLLSLGGQHLTVKNSLTLSFAAGRISGTDGCNRFSGPYHAANTHIKIGPEILSTQMGCPYEVMRQASSYMGALLSAEGYRMGHGELRLMGAADIVLAVFVASTKPE